MRGRSDGLVPAMVGALRVTNRRRALELSILARGGRLTFALGDLRVVHGPGDDQAIGADLAMQLASGLLAVHVARVSHRADAEHVEVEMGVAGDERIERPIDHAPANPRDRAALIFLEPTADPEVLH